MHRIHREQPARKNRAWGFELAYNGSLYATCRVGKRAELCRLAWNPFTGYTPTKGELSAEVRHMAAVLLSLHEGDAATYPLCGERYVGALYDAEGTTRINLRRAPRDRQTLLRRVLPVTVRLLLSLLFACLVAYMACEHAGEWLSTVFPGRAPGDIKMFLWWFEIMGTALLFLLLGNRTGPFELFCNAMLPVGAAVMGGVLKRYWWINLLLCPLCLLLYAYAGRLLDEPPGAPRLSRRKRDDSGHRPNRLRYTALFAIASAIVLANIASALSPSTPVRMADEACTDEALLSRYRESCIWLSEDRWDRLSAEQKRLVMQGVSDYECRVTLGCEAVAVWIGETETDGDTVVLGSYSDSRRAIIVNGEHLAESSVREVLDTVLHEVRHAYQHRIAEAYEGLAPYMSQEQRNLLLFNEAAAYSQNLHDYISSDAAGYVAYAEQLVEKDCRAWAEERYNEVYRDMIRA